MLALAFFRISEYLSRSVLERVIAYLFISELLVKLIFELGLGVWHFELSRQKQFFFYTFMLMDYAFNIGAISRIKLRINYIFYFMVGLAFISLQGIVVGIVSGNRIFEIFNDTIPLVVLILNALWMQSYSEITKKIDVNRLLLFCSIVMTVSCLIGLVAVSIGRPAKIASGGILLGIYIPLFFSALISRNFKSHSFIFFTILILFNYQELNRTSMMFMVLCLLIYLITVFINRPASASVILVAILGLFALGWSVLPEESGTYRRIVALTNIDLQDRQGSIGERGEEYRSIKNELRFSGESAVIFGLGHGGLYSVKHTHQYIKDHGHAHYSWALFNLRYGATGYIYVIFIFLILVFHGIRVWDVSRPINVFISLLCLESVLYMGTYVSFIILIAGVQFCPGSIRGLGKEGVSLQLNKSI